MKAIAAAHALDVVTFAVAVGVAGVSIEAELNPTMVLAYAVAGVIGVALWKGALVGVLVLLVGRVRTRSRRPARLLAYTFGLVGAAANLVALGRILAG